MAISPARRQTRTEWIVETLSGQITAKEIRAGDRILSIRAAAAAYGVSKNTVTEAYERLIALGCLESRKGSGYYVAETASPRPPVPSTAVKAALDLVSLLREQLDRHYEVRPGDGRPPEAWTHSGEFRKFFGSLKWPQENEIEHGYGNSWGYQPLRERLALMLIERSIKATEDQILMTHGANHALDLVIRYMLQPGDVVFVDDPGYYPLYGKLKLAHVEMVGIRRGPDGPDLDDLDEKLAIYRPKLFFTQSQAHNPTGSTLSMAVAHSLLQRADRYNFHIVEDDVFADILPAAAPRLAALDQLRRVIYVGSFSKTLSASLRCGFVAADAAMIDALCDIKMLTVVATSDYVERLIFNMIASGHYLRHLRRLRARIQEAHKNARGSLTSLGLSIAPPQIPSFYLWAELPAHVDERALCEAAADQSIFMAPGQVFRPDLATVSHPAIRINIAHAQNPKFLAFLSTYLRQ